MLKILNLLQFNLIFILGRILFPQILFLSAITGNQTFVVIDFSAQIILSISLYVWAAAGINLVGVPQTKPMQRFLSNFQDISTTKGSRAD